MCVPQLFYHGTYIYMSRKILINTLFESNISDKLSKTIVAMQLRCYLKRNIGRQQPRENLNQSNVESVLNSVLYGIGATVQMSHLTHNVTRSYKLLVLS